MADPVLGIALNPDLDEHQKLHMFAKEVCARGASVSALGRFALSKLQESYNGNLAGLAADVARYDDFARARHEAYGKLLKDRDLLDRQAEMLERRRQELDKALTAFEQHGTPVPETVNRAAQEAIERMKGVMTIVRKSQG